MLGATFTVLVIASLRLDARLWLADYPPDIRAAVGPGVTAPAFTRLLAGVVLVTVLLGGVLWSNLRVWREAPAAYGFVNAFAHIFALFQFVNLVDVVVVDQLTTMMTEFGPDVEMAPSLSRIPVSSPPASPASQVD